MDYEKILSFAAAGFGAVVVYLYGGWSDMLTVLLTFVVVDYITGVITAAVNGKLSSEVGLKGIAKKVAIFVVVAVAHFVDRAVGTDNNLFMSATAFFYMANELISILENIIETGMPVPETLKDAVDILKRKSEINGGKGE